MAGNYQGHQVLNFNCDSCNQPIAPSSPRIHCQICHDYDLCANCALGDRFNERHLASHPIQLYKQSGGVNGGEPILSRNTITFAQPLPYGSPPSFPSHTPSNGLPNLPPPLPPRRPGPVSGNRPPPGMPDQRWQPFFLPDMTPTTTFTTLLNDIFSHLDSSNSGYLVPEAYSRFLDDLGYVGQENSWKAGYIATLYISAESMADKSLKNTFDLFSIDHVVQQRIQPTHVDPTGTTSLLRGFLGNAFNPSMLQTPGIAEGPMPLLTRKGFLDITTIEVLGDPSKEWGNLSRVIRKYDLPRYRSWGDLPRSALPDLPDPRTLQKVAAIHEVAKAKAARELASVHAGQMLAAQGRQNALDLISGDTRYYRYY
ncbi:hypothetical protein BDZ94DRAFT_1232380 [Collybia nuda]|uniref:ZZ-type domain-containing protein n=1 Tax=Collybia nuda TaxID=64659 RepID=A0A9P6CJ33_9AGAR|nr:hypothetical protein BDZ94DRAFT_1232380 [Collybia nuda]